MAAIPITVWKVNAARGSAPRIERYAEKSAITALKGVPTVFNGGFIQESAAIANATATFIGFSTEPFSNLASDGVAKTLTFGSVQNQVNAVNIPQGAPLNLGDIGNIIAEDDIEFVGGCDAGVNFTQTDIGVIYGLTKAANNYWKIDKTKTTEAGGACIKITELVDPSGTDGGRVAFVVNQNRQALHNA